MKPPPREEAPTLLCSSSAAFFPADTSSLSGEPTRDGPDPITYFSKEQTIRHINHSCAANAELIVSLHPTPIGMLRCLRPIEAETEVTINYLPKGLSLRQRQHHLREHFQYECRCRRCEHDMQQQRLREQRTSSNFLWTADRGSEAPRGPPTRDEMRFLKPKARQGSKSSLFEYRAYSDF